VLITPLTGILAGRRPHREDIRGGRADGGRAGAAEMFFIHTLASGTNIG